MVVKRGGCSFLQKAQEAHRRQARAVIIVNNEDRLERWDLVFQYDESISEYEMNLTNEPLIKIGMSCVALLLGLGSKRILLKVR